MNHTARRLRDRGFLAGVSSPREVVLTAGTATMTHNARVRKVCVGFYEDCDEVWSTPYLSRWQQLLPPSWLALVFAGTISLGKLPRDGIKQG